MSQEEKELLLKDLSARLLYEVKGRVYAEVSDGKYDISGDMIFYDAPFDVILDSINISTEEIHVVAIGNEDTVEFIEMQQTDGAPYTICEFKPYLRPMSSISEEERNNLRAYCRTQEGIIYDIGVSGAINSPAIIDWLNSHYFDYRNLIEKGLALVAPKGMY